jgi:hypothetical protein
MMKKTKKNPLSLPKQFAKDWSVHSVLSFDSCHTVYLLTHCHDKQKGVLKVYQKQQFSAKKYRLVSKLPDTYLLLPRKYIHTFQADYVLYDKQESLEDMIYSAGLSFQELLTLGIHLTRAAQTLTQAKYYGADINPCNIYCKQDGTFVLGDLDMDKGYPAETSDYVAPERKNAKKADNTLYDFSMQYSICKLLEALCLLQKDFLTEEMRNLLGRGLQENPHQRFASLEELQQSLSDLSDSTAGISTQLLVLHQKNNPLFMAKTSPLAKKTYPVVNALTTGGLCLSILLFAMVMSREIKTVANPTAITRNDTGETYTSEVSTVENEEEETEPFESEITETEEAEPSESEAIETDDIETEEAEVSDGDIMETDTDNFQELDVRKKGLYSFSTITETTENPEDYSCIYGGGNFFSNLNTISSFSHVKEVYLDDNQIRDIGEIKDCTQVEILVLSYNYIEDVTSLETLSSLSHLDLSSNKTLKDISPLGNITSLRTLNISGTKVSEKQYRWLCKKLPQCQIIY